MSTPDTLGAPAAPGTPAMSAAPAAQATLSTLQTAFQDYVLGQAGAQPAIAAQVREQGGLAADARLAIYYNAYRIRLREALCDAFDKTWTLIGDALFFELAESYVAAQPSSFRNLRWFGDGFAAWCAQELADYPFVAELAALEWTLGLAFDAPDAPPASAASLAGIVPDAWGELQFHLHPSLYLLDEHWNTAALWQALHDGAEPPEAEALEAPRRTLVWRNGLRPNFRVIDAHEDAALAAIAAGASFGAICEAAVAREDAAMPRMAGYLQNWLASGLLTLVPVAAGVPL